MCLSECSIWKVDDYTIALYWWLQSFNWDYEKYLNALYSWDSEKKK